MPVKVKVLIVDDELPARQKLRLFLEEKTNFEVIGEAKNGVETLQKVDLFKPDLIFLDIQMPKLDGLAVASNLENNPDVNIVFVTGFNEYAIKAFELNAVDYLLKPFDKGRLDKTLQRFIEKSRAAYSIPKLVQDYRSKLDYPEQLLFKTETGIQVVKVSDIEWVESSGNYVKVCLSANAFIARQTLTTVQSQLSPTQFIRIHRSHIINISQVTKAISLSKGDYTIVLKSGTELRLSRSYKDAFFKLFSA